MVFGVIGPADSMPSPRALPQLSERRGEVFEGRDLGSTDLSEHRAIGGGRPAADQQSDRLGQ
jgi:hypothetical protein